MPPKASTERMSDTAVQTKTGKTWNEWFAILGTRRSWRFSTDTASAPGGGRWSP
jgi:hypothetical protein